MVTMKGLLCRINLKIHDPPPLPAPIILLARTPAALAGVAPTVMIPAHLTAAALCIFPRQNRSASGRQTLCLPVSMAEFDHLSRL